MTLTQCRAMASANGTFPRKSRGGGCRRRVPHRLYAIAVSNAATRRGRGKNVIACPIATAKRAEVVLSPPLHTPPSLVSTPSLMLIEPRAGSLGTLNLGRGRSSNSTFAVTAIATCFRLPSRENILIKSSHFQIDRILKVSTYYTLDYFKKFPSLLNMYTYEYF